MSETTLTGHNWVAFGAAGAMGTIRRTEAGYEARVLRTDGTPLPNLFAGGGAARGGGGAGLKPFWHPALACIGFVATLLPKRLQLPRHQPVAALAHGAGFCLVVCHQHTRHARVKRALHLLRM